jgi:hypothetical protein
MSHLLQPMSPSRPSRPALAAACLVASLSLVACGGGGGDYAAAPAPAPSAIDQIAPGASQGAAGLLSYLTALATVAMGVADSREPLALDGFAPATAEDSEPAAVSVPGA